MKQTIWKTELKLIDEQVISIPKGSKILTLQPQSDIPCIWFLCNPDERTFIKQKIHIFGTGQDIPIDFKPIQYIGTFQAYSGVLVFHVFKGTQGE